MKTNKTKIVIAAAIAAVSMAAFTGCSGTYTIDENGAGVNVSHVDGTRANAAQAVSDEEIKIEAPTESAPAVQASSNTEDSKAAPAQTAAPAQETAPAATSAAAQNAAPAETTVIDQVADPVQTTTAAQAQTNSEAVDVSAISQAADNAIDVLNKIEYASSGQSVRWSDGAYTENFEPITNNEETRFYHLNGYSSSDLEYAKGLLYGGYLSENLLNTHWNYYRAENAIVEHNGEYYYDNRCLGTGNYGIYERTDNNVNIIDDNTCTVNVREKDGMNISGDGINTTITLKKTADGLGWQIDSIG